MGYITTLTANNDCIHELPRYEDLGKRIYDAISGLTVSDGVVHDPVTGITAVESHHADYAMGILVGGGRHAQLVERVSVYYQDDDPEITFLKQLAEKHGYNLRKRPRKGRRVG